MTHSHHLAQALGFIGKKVTVEVDRPLYSEHPKHGFVYELNYGFVPGTESGDGEELDVYIMGIDKPVEAFEGTCVAVVHRTNDNDDKLVVVPNGAGVPSDADIRAATHFQEQFFQSKIFFT